MSLCRVHVGNFKLRGLVPREVSWLNFKIVSKHSRKFAFALSVLIFAGFCFGKCWPLFILLNTITKAYFRGGTKFYSEYSWRKS